MRRQQETMLDWSGSKSKLSPPWTVFALHVMNLCRFQLPLLVSFLLRLVRIGWGVLTLVWGRGSVTTIME